MNELKAKIAALGKRHHYQAWREDFEMSGMGDNTDELVLDAVTLEDYKSKFTQTNFQEELVGFFPLLHSIMRETNTVDLEEYVSEKDVEEGFMGNMIDKAKGMFGKTPAAPAAPAPAAGNNGAHADGKPNSWMEPNMRKDFENAEISSFLLYNIRMIYRWAKEGRNISDYIQDLKKLENENISKPTTAAAFKFIMDNLASGEVTDPKMIMQIADKAHTLMGHSDIEQATREGVDKSQVPAYKRKEQGGDWKMSTKDLEKEKTNSPTSSAGLARKKAELGMSEELASIMKLSGLAK